MYPNRVGGIAASCSEAFRPYNPVLANLTGVCYWWGWIPTCVLTAIFSASAIHEWYLPGVPVTAMACGIVLLFTAVNLCGVHWAGRLAVPIATASAALAFISALAPVITGQVDWQRASTFHLTVPVEGWFGELTSLLAGLDEAATRRKCGGNGAERFTLSAAPDLACGRILINRCDLAGERGLPIDREPWLE